jgi:hypothetical protein
LDLSVLGHHPVQKSSLLGFSLPLAGKTAAYAIGATANLARAYERRGYHHFWLVNNHNVPCILVRLR